MYISLSDEYKNRVEGLCGNYNGNSVDEFHSEHMVASDATEFGNLYRTIGSCPVEPADPHANEPCYVNNI